MQVTSTIEKMKELAGRKPIVRAAEAAEAGISRTALTRLVRAGTVERVGRGLYRLADGLHYEHPDLVEAVVRVPKGVIVLLSALSFHGIGTHSAWKVWMLLPANFPTPRIAYPPLRIVRSRKPESFTAGVDTHLIAGHAVRITDPDRTIVDCFKHRNTVTLEVCIEALRERLQNQRQSIESLERYARMMGVARVMRPYLEALA